MAAKIIVVICAQAVLIQTVLSQFILPNTVTGNSAVDNNVIIGNNFASGLSGGFIGNGISGTGGAGKVFNNVGGIVGNGISGSSSTAAVNSQTGLNFVPFIVTSSSPIAPTGISIASENTLDGILSVTGQLPYLGVVAFEGSLPTAGTGVSTCGCGNGEVGMVSEGIAGPSNGMGLNAINAQVRRQ